MFGPKAAVFPTEVKLVFQLFCASLLGLFYWDSNANFKYSILYSKSNSIVNQQVLVLCFTFNILKGRVLFVDIFVPCKIGNLFNNVYGYCINICLVLRVHMLL